MLSETCVTRKSFAELGAGSQKSQPRPCLATQEFLARQAVGDFEEFSRSNDHQSRKGEHFWSDSFTPWLSPVIEVLANSVCGRLESGLVHPAGHKCLSKQMN
jgi:hypothetical protein